ncbi:ABC transporter permease [Conexibacter sp. JD483]|uniref:ABC transporter permease n=1 Tax=unclassified Conexibacter TaxID=2627773 RepID=UPI00271CA1E1|nr:MULTISPECIES: ABC transporter permease [unclassified Conexibacter]MDO8188473.1 ABC transporter permease [Conexibacter sp. CPCC 205706]MDO8201451.1 ABC transporter permease [Conexibacter sp. CPCC 205762]MDR9371757.1 ABC transporter permease [Conexibacter sp. JD483]
MSVRSTPAQTLPVPARRASSRLRGAFGGSGVAWLLAPPLVFLALVLVVPLGYLVYLASQESGFSRALDNSIFTDSIPRTFVLAAVVTAFAMVLGTIYAMALAIAPRWAAVLMLVALITLFWTSLLVRTYGWMILYFPRGPLYDALHAVGLRDRPLDIYQTNLASYPAMVHVMLPFVVLPVYASLLQLDPLQVRAARVLGAKPLLILRSVVLPQLRAGLLAAGVLVFIMSLGFYVTPEMLGSPNGAMVAGVIGGQFNLPGQTSTAAAMSVLLVIVIVVVYAAADRLFGVSKHWGRS